MAETMEIFVDSNVQLEEFTHEIGALLGLELKRESDEYETWYEYRDPQVVLTINEHGFDNDKDMNFEDYRYVIQVRAITAGTEQTREMWREGMAQRVLEKLEAANRYPLLMTANVQRKVSESQSAVHAA